MSPRKRFTNDQELEIMEVEKTARDACTRIARVIESSREAKRIAAERHVRDELELMKASIERQVQNLVSERGLSINELAQLMLVSPEWLIRNLRVATTSTDLRILARIAAILGCTVEVKFVKLEEK